MRRLGRVFHSLTSTHHFCTSSTISLNHILTTHLHNNSIVDATILFEDNPTSRNIVSYNIMLALYVKNDRLRHAQKLFDEMPIKDVVSWNSMLLGLRKTKNPQRVCTCFLQMRRTSFSPNEYSISLVLSAVNNTEFNILVAQIHSFVVRAALNSSLFVGSALMRGYADVGDPVALSRVFDEILDKDISSWNALVSGYMKMGWMREAVRVFDAMPEKNIVSWTSLMNGYIDNKRINKARSIFNKMREKNVVSWTAMISGYVQNQHYMDALRLFPLMLKSGIPPNHFTFSSVLDACAGCCLLLTGQQVHSSILKSGIPDDIILLSSLVDMYAKCGDIDSAFCVFECIPNKNVVSWNTMIGGYARHGLAARALDEFERMTRSGIKPDQVTFINVLSACAHGGMIKEGEKHFDSMAAKYRIQAVGEHYACMVDLYGRAGLLEEAVRLVKKMPIQPDVVVWGALLAACGLHSSLELGEFAAKGINRLKNEHPAAYSALLKIHGEKGSWNNVTELREMMKGNRVRKQSAGSWVEPHSSPSYSKTIV
ncbi:Tetratricopeptide-like helical domain containing protein [Parasponia andersonii]|uniref:Tetratricopeptide-like helical domain containing protein n=1 Tax=Parasponia andersonii TaxID=3476 RepID=A0A2P5CL37_PARAD|nr:Tetratricopeptide-like helical domain containing protein [Parasponia andersonii]